jgi:8-oxo-dGTP diphosphatase
VIVRSPSRARIAGRARHLLRLAEMLAIRRTPLPWRWKHRVLRALSPKVVVVGLAVIPDEEGRVLMLRARYSGVWILPGGTLHVGEDPLTGTLRECREELGANVAVERLTGIYAYRRDAELLISFRCAPLPAPPSLSEEHDAWCYARPDEIRPPVDAIARDALADAGEPRITRLDGGSMKDDR